MLDTVESITVAPETAAKNDKAPKVISAQPALFEELPEVKTLEAPDTAMRHAGEDLPLPLRVTLLERIVDEFEASWDEQCEEQKKLVSEIRRQRGIVAQLTARCEALSRVSQIARGGVARYSV